MTGKRYEGIWSDSNSLCHARGLGHTCMYFPKFKECTHKVYKFHSVQIFPQKGQKKKNLGTSLAVQVKKKKNSVNKY